jgi:MYXO-CTERM domain-containing protein
MGKVEFDVQIRNQGTSACPGNFYVDFWPAYPCTCDTPPWVCNQATDVSWELASFELAGGQSQNRSVIEFLPPSTVPFRYLLFVDSWIDNAGFCPESNENNNRICGEFTVDPAIARADLEIIECEAGQDPEDPGSVLLSAHVRNSGGGPTSRDVTVEFFLESASGDCLEFLGEFGDSYGTVPAGLASGGSQWVVSQPVGPIAGGEYRLLALVNPHGEEQELSLANNCCQKDLVWLDRPDLVVEEFTVYAVGATVVYRGRVANRGFRDVFDDEPFKVCVYYDSLEGPGLCQTPDVEMGEGFAKHFADGLPLDDSVEFGQSKGGLPNGLYNVWARADCDCELLESDEKNNDFKQQFVLDVPGPDLAVKSFSGRQIIVEGTSYVEYLVAVVNQGTDPILTSSDIDVFFDSPDAPDLDSLDMMEGEFVQAPPLGPGEYFQAEVIWRPLGGVPPGEYRSWVVLDIMNGIFETNEINNVVSIPVTVGPVSQEGVNLTAENFTARVVGTDVSYLVTVRNNGGGDLDAPFDVHVFQDRRTQPTLADIGDLRVEIPRLAAGSAATVELNWQGAPDGEYFSWLVVDAGNRIAETNEADNISGPRIVVVCRDCDACPDDTYLSSACVCGEETVSAGFCCSGEWFAIGCPPGHQEHDDVASMERGSVELSATFVSGDGCGCRMGRGQAPLPGEALLLVILFAVVWIRLRKSSPLSCGP